MKKTYIIRSILMCIMLLFGCLLSACSPTPDNADIEAAIRLSLSEEESPPVPDFESMEVSKGSAGKANIVLWTADREVRRNYTLEYDKETRIFAVTQFTTYLKNADGTYYPVPDNPGLILAELTPCFDFTDDFEQKYLLFYAGEGDDIMAVRTKFENEKLPDLTAEQLASFEVCDLGGNTLILLVPRYKGLSVWINEIEHQGDMMKQGAEVARFGAKPVYIYCSFSDKLPEHEIHISFDSLGEFFTTRESLIENMK